jgi:hypothetical protein
VAVVETFSIFTVNGVSAAAVAAIVAAVVAASSVVVQLLLMVVAPRFAERATGSWSPGHAIDQE